MSAPVLRGEAIHWSRPAGPDEEPIPVLQGVDIAVHPGEIVAVQGPSGCGKTVLCTTLMRLRQVRPPGRVWWGEREVTHLSPRTLAPLRAHHQGMLQHTGAILPPFTSVRASLIETARQVAQDKQRALAQLEDLAGRFGLTRLLDRRPRYLSGGEQRKASLCRILLTSPRFLFADEPDSGLDPLSQQEVLKLFRGTVDELGIGLLIITHNQKLADEYADRRLQLREGVLHEAS